MAGLINITARGFVLPSWLLFPPEFRPDPRNKVEISATRKHPEPQQQFGSIYHHSNYIKAWLEDDGYQREEVSACIDPDKDKRNTSNSTMLPDIPVVRQYTGGK
jgi:hypothetical protein